MQSNMLGAVYWIDHDWLPVDFPTQVPSQNILSAEWETAGSYLLLSVFKKNNMCANFFYIFLYSDIAAAVFCSDAVLLCHMYSYFV